MKRFLRALFRPDWRCLSCGDEIFTEGKYFCPRCEEKLPYHTVICDHCGRAVPVAQSYCYECKNQLTEVDRARSAFSYEPPVSGLIQSFKYRNRRYLAEAFASALARVYFSQCEVCDLMVFVPMTRRRERERGYNQTALLARELSARIGVPLAEEALVQIRDTPRQADLSAAERRENLVGSFRVHQRKEVENKTILLVDDVLTTGATAEAIARALKGAGAKRVILLTVASVRSRREEEKE